MGKGDILEYQVHWRSTRPLVPGQFWFVYNFQPTGIVLHERLEIRVPADRPIKAKGPQATQTIATEAGSRIYSWTYSKLQNVDPGVEQKREMEATRGRLPPPDVQISSFQTWDEVGRWYWSLLQDRVEPTPAIRAKAAELTMGMTDSAAKLQALYNFVSVQYRYIGIAFGIGRYQPHSAEDVLTNNYGDCKDKHTLLESLLQASGIRLYPALVNSTRQIDPDVPSPAQFDHIIGYLPPSKDKDKDKDALWLDTTPEVAPLGFLFDSIRDKSALVIEEAKSAKLIITPADPPFPSSNHFKIDAKLNEDGSLQGKIEDTIRGEREVPLRSAFRRVPQSNWKELVQQISLVLGFAGTVSDVNATPPEIVRGPFQMSYSYSRKDYPDWSNHQFTVPGLPFFLPPVKDDEKNPIWLGAPQQATSEAKIELPKGYQSQLPSNVDLTYDFAEYHASYSQNQNILTAERRFVSKLHEIPVSELDDYRTFVKNLQNDVNRYVQTTASSGSYRLLNNPLPGQIPSFIRSIDTLPDSPNPIVNQLEHDGLNAMKSDDEARVEYSLKTAVAKDPKFTRGWLRLGVSYMRLGVTTEAIAAFQEAIRTDPSQPISRRVLAFALTIMNRRDEAIHAWQDLLKLVPDDSDAVTNLCVQLETQNRYAEALPYLEAAVKHDDSAVSENRLGVAYLHTGQIEKGTAALGKAVEADSSAETLNQVAYELAEANAGLDKALGYAQKAVELQEKQSHEIDLSTLLPEDLTRMQAIPYFWDTLGWVHFRLGNLDQAEDYLHAAWLFFQQDVVADHLGQVYERQNKRERAIRMYRLALALPELGTPRDEIRRRLEHLSGARAASSPLRSDPGSELTLMRNIKLKRLVPGSATAEFFLLFRAGSKRADVQFITGSDRLRGANDVLAESAFPVAFPQSSSATLVRRAIVSCSSVSGCQAVLLIMDLVKSVK